MTKYCELVNDPQKIRFCLEKAYYYAVSGRPGPCWLDIPLNVQATVIETEELKGFDIPEQKQPSLDECIDTIIKKINQSERPVLLIGNGVRLANAHREMMRLVDLLNIPVVTGMSSVDAIPSDHPLYVGRSGTTGDRAGNFAVQNTDLFISFGSRLSLFQTGFNYESWARCAYKIVNDIDAEELKKDSINADVKICCDVYMLIKAMLEKIQIPLRKKEVWIHQCQKWREEYPVVQEKHYQDTKPNIYVFYHELTKRLGATDRLVVSVGTSRVAGSQASIIKEGMRFITNASTASMGYCLPAAIGVCIANSRKSTILVTGEGSIQMNLQELQTIVQNKLPIKIFVMNNGGYHSVRMTQNSFFGKRLVGVGEESGDLSFPDMSKIAYAYGIEYIRCDNPSKMNECIDWTLGYDGFCMCEVVLSSKQVTEPKTSSKRLPDGRMVSAPLEDMAPFLPREELAKNMYIPLLDEERF